LSNFIRYGFSWFALNAIFSRPGLLNAIGLPKAGNSEYEHFLVLFNATNIPSAEHDLTISTRSWPRTLPKRARQDSFLLRQHVHEHLGQRFRDADMVSDGLYEVFLVHRKLDAWKLEYGFGRSPSFMFP
jgi:hypothetical protein